MTENNKRLLTGLVYITLMLFGTTYSQESYFILFSFLGIVCLYEMWKLRRGRRKILAFTYILLPFFLIQLFGITDNNYSNIEFNPSLILLILILTWVFDTSAYIIGIQFGTHKILPSISPKKSWEGFIGGFIFTLLTGYLISKYSLKIVNYKPIIISSFLPITATIGDFIASYYKREANVKNFGNYLPGHGGLLDRMDALMITIPVLYIYINLI